MAELVVVGDPGDPRQAFVRQAVDHWNEQLRLLGSSFRLGPVSSSMLPVPEPALQAAGRSGRPGRAAGRPQRLHKHAGFGQTMLQAFT